MKQTISVFIVLCLMLVSETTKAQRMNTAHPQSRYDFQVQTLELNDSVTIGYIEKGEGPLTLLMVHGLGGNMKHWEKNFDELSKQYRCIAIDLPGYWSSATKEAWVSDDYMTFFADQLNAFTKKKKLDKPVLMGHSMGGQISIVATLQAPELYSKLLLAAPAGIETFSAEQAALLKQMTQPALLMGQKEPALRQAFAINFYKVPEGLEAMIQDRLWLNQTSYFKPYCEIVYKGVAGMLDHPVFNRLGDLKLPVLVIFGAEDKLIPNSYLNPRLKVKNLADAASEKIPNAQVVILPEAGHLLQYDQPEAFNATVREYLELEANHTENK